MSCAIARLFHRGADLSAGGPGNAYTYIGTIEDGCIRPSVGGGLTWSDAPRSRQVEAALHSDPFFYDEHVTVTINNGVVTLRGVFDDWDLRDAMRIAKKIPGVRRVINDLEIELGGE